jgi:tRNA(fMet)-specific endonuclease VapC
MTYLLDTDFVADWLNDRPPAVALFPRLLEEGVAMSIINHSETLEGILGSRNPREAEQVFRTFLQGVRVLPVTRTVSRRHAMLRRELRRRGRQVNERALDLLIAATALAYDLTLVTSNTRDFQDVPGLTLLNHRTGETRQYPA